MSEQIRRLKGAKGNLYSANSGACNLALEQLRDLLLDIGFKVHKKTAGQATLRVYPAWPARYPLLNPRFSPTAVALAESSETECLMVGVLSRVDDPGIESRLAAFTPTPACLFTTHPFVAARYYRLYGSFILPLRFLGERDNQEIDFASLKVPLTQILEFLRSTDDNVTGIRPIKVDRKPKPIVGQGEFRVGDNYSRADIYRLLRVPPNEQGGDWDTGYHQHRGEWFIFCTVGQPGRTGHDYRNRFEGNELVWTGRTGARWDHPSIQSIASGEHPVHVFFRLADREPFTYQGIAHAVSVAKEKMPVEIRWRFDDASQPGPERPPEELTEGETYTEGAKQQITVNAYERNPAARRRCIEYYGTTCVVCGFDFAVKYGELGNGFIHVHHLRPLAKIGEEYELDPIADLRPVCPNCHSMIHRRAVAYGIEELQALLQGKIRR